MHRCGIFVLVLVPLCAALPSRPAVPLRAPGAALRLKGGNCPQLLPASAAILGVQGGMLALANSGATEKTYSMGVELDALDRAMMETWGFCMLGLSAMLVALHQGFSLSKAMTVQTLLLSFMEFRWIFTHSNIPGVNVPKSVLSVWMLLAAGVSYLAWNEGAGLISGSDLPKYWGYFFLVNAILPVFAMDQFVAVYGITLEGQVKRRLGHTAFGFGTIPSSLFLIFAGDSTMKGLGAMWSASAVHNAIALYMEDWKTFKLPNGIPHVFWMVLSMAGAYSAFKMA